MCGDGRDAEATVAAMNSLTTSEMMKHCYSNCQAMLHLLTVCDMSTFVST